VVGLFSISRNGLAGVEQEYLGKILIPSIKEESKLYQLMKQDRRTFASRVIRGPGSRSEGKKKYAFIVEEGGEGGEFGTQKESSKEKNAILSLGG